METSLQYPIGKYEPKPYSEAQKKEWINDINWLPADIENSVLNLDEAQLQTPYRPGGWTVHQLVHHVSDSHLNAFCRFKIGLTEDNPNIRPYDQERWALLKDTELQPINISITLLFALHKKWVTILENISDEEWNRKVFHPETKQEMSLWYLLGSYAWHGRHHTQHILGLRERNNW
ncbi:YfiT family bacillithiol transferase [Rhizosphaericola mali]|uniref:Putative metal-dependent hydrolase n=1 Tax=Rhizosphaericola mali TaxID=2545455 RepID=A0A5P2G3Z9_9BACT|nr:putative metal-dependent hydrolase [Rhizosphaericola mali]QES88480.1 putative metal-dependent hydrolase [Rhizosphaericola mali]